MKWFKHMTDSYMEEAMADLEDKAGLEGYGFYYKMAEIISANMDASDKCGLEFTPSRWARQVNVTTKKWLFLVRCCSDVGLTSVYRNGDKWGVKIPKLLKCKDEYTKKSGQAPDKLRSKEVEVEVEEDKEKEKEKKEKKENLLSPDGDGCLLKQTVEAKTTSGFEDFRTSWQTSHWKQAKGKCYQAWKKTNAECHPTPDRVSH